ncbi:MAG: hypothetical protein MJ250_05105 [Alphaproteobacteria bacterium]|nr:hypothetical protein [Alphaproteobacteria bacterium]
MSEVVMISVVRNFEMYERLVKSNSFNQKAEFVVFDNNKENIGISARYNSFLENNDYSKDAWFIFCHEDWELKEDISSKLSNLDKNALYGPIGVTFGKFWKLATTKGEITQSDKDGNDISKQGHFVHTNEVVGTFDCQCLIVHSSLIKKYNLRFDENLLFDLYVEDFCINAREKYDICSKVLQMECQHYSEGNITDRFYKQLKYLRNKYKNVKAIYCTIANASAISRPLLFSSYVFIRKVCRFFYQSKITRKGNKLIKIFKLPMFQVRVGK